MYQKNNRTQNPSNASEKQANHQFHRVKKTIRLHGSPKPLQNLGKMKDFIVVKKPLEEEVARDPVQVGRRTKEDIRKINGGAVARAPIVSPLARDYVLHGFRKPWETIGKTLFLDTRKPWKP